MRRWLSRASTRRAILVVAASTALAACSSSGGSSSPGSPNSGSSTGATGAKTITIGFVTDLTGPASSGFLTSKQGIAKITPRKAGKLKLQATTKGYIRSALTSVSVSS